MKKHLLWMAAAAVCMTACTSDPVVSEDAPVVPPPTEDAVEAEQPTLSTATLGSFAASQNRFVVEPQTRAEDVNTNPIQLIATIENLSKEAGKVPGFAVESNGRYLSATCVYYDAASETYYVTYHMQGQNYSNPTQQDETSGYIETFTINGTTPVPGKIFFPEDASKLDFDFNHLYFDDLNESFRSATYSGPDKDTPRIIAVGHKSEPSSKEGGEPNTAAIIGKLNLDGATPSFEYSVVYTGEKIYDAAGRSLGKVDAADVNCVLRKENYYVLATRKGIAVLNALPDNLFSPLLDASENVYFLKTPGSVKHLTNLDSSYHLAALYLTEGTDVTGNTATSKSAAKIAHFTMYRGMFGGGTNFYSGGWYIDDIATQYTEKGGMAGWPEQSAALEAVTPVDGKNVLDYSNRAHRFFACLGKGGLYVGTGDRGEIIKFSDATDGSRSVNGVFGEQFDAFDEKQQARDPYIYVANGRCLTIIDPETFETVADYTVGLKDKDGNDIEASANYVHVVQTATMTNGTTPDRIITVAYGQAGVKVFKFVPPTR